MVRPTRKVKTVVAETPWDDDQSPKCAACGGALDWLFMPGMGMRCLACGRSAESYRARVEQSAPLKLASSNRA